MVLGLGYPRHRSEHSDIIALAIIEAAIGSRNHPEPRIDLDPGSPGVITSPPLKPRLIS